VESRCSEVGSGAVRHMAALEPSRARRWGPQSCDTWQHRSPPEQGGRVRCREARGSTRSCLSREAGFGAVGHVAASEPISIWRQGPELQNMWQCVDVRHSPYLDLKVICGGTRTVGYRHWPSDPTQERLQTRMWGQLFSTLFDYHKLFAWQLKR
jgi:hypothetical protein